MVSSVDSTQLAAAIKNCLSISLKDIAINNLSLYVELASKRKMVVDDFVTLATIAYECGLKEVIILKRDSIFTVQIVNFKRLINNDIDLIEFLSRIEADAYTG